MPDAETVTFERAIFEIFADLYARYDLSDDEIAFVERLVRPIQSGGGPGAL